MLLLSTLMISICSISVIHGQTTKPPSNCSTELCNSSSSSNTSCSSPITCYIFRTSINTNLCAPKDDCSLFDKCINGTRCATNTSVCVVNSCCAAPICIPVVFSRICTQHNNTNSPLTSKTTVATAKTTSRKITTTSKASTRTTARATTITSTKVTTSTKPTTITSTISIVIDDCTWSAWVNGACSVTCGTGVYARQRLCLDQFSSSCSTCLSNGTANGTRPCYYPSCAF